MLTLWTVSIQNFTNYRWCPLLSLLNRPRGLKGFGNLLKLPLPDIMRKSMCLAFQNACEFRIKQHDCATVSRNVAARVCSSTQNQWSPQIKPCSFNGLGPSIFYILKNKLQHFVKGSFCNCEWYSRQYRSAAPIQLRPWDWEKKPILSNKTSAPFRGQVIFYLFKYLFEGGRLSAYGR